MGLLIRELFTLLARLPIALIVMPLIVITYAALRKKPKWLPTWLDWFNTPDESLPGDLRNEPTVKWVYDKFGWYVCTWYWLGLRNVLHGLAWRYGKPATNYLVHLTADQQREQGVHRTERRVGPLVIISGYGVHVDKFHKFTKNWFWAVPTVSIRFYKKGG
jgi:hypothetical protein